VKAAARKKLKGEAWLEECFEDERRHEIAFASPRALLEARMIAEMDKARRPHRRNHRNSVARSRNGKAVYPPSPRGLSVKR
jgi:hypothetical protein